MRRGAAVLAALALSVQTAPAFSAVSADSADEAAHRHPIREEMADALSGASLDLSEMRAPVAEGERSFRADELPARPGDFWVAFEDTGAGEDAFRQSLAPLVESLRERHPDRRVVVTRIPSVNFAEEVRRRGIPFVMSTSGTMVSLMQEANVVPLASRGGDAGALLVVRRNPDPEAKPVTLADMKGKRLAYADASAFGPKSWLDVRVMQLDEDPETFWGQTERRARVLPDVLTPLSTGRIDAALLLLLLLVLHSVRANHLVRVRTSELTEALHERDRMEEEAKRGRERLSAVERAGIISQMSGMFAHELKQPLAAVRNYVGGLQLRAKMTPNPDPMTLEVLSAIDEEASRAAGIVERVRSYAKAGARKHGETNLTDAVRRAVDYARRHDSRCAPVQLVPGGALGAGSEEDVSLTVWGDALELELLILNLVRNASHAATTNDAADPAVRVSLEEKNGKAVVTVEDNGPALTDEAFARLTGWGDSIKREGLGIGLSICRGIADRHGAALKFTRRTPHGVAAKLSVPLWDGIEPGAEAESDESAARLTKNTPSADGTNPETKR